MKRKGMSEPFSGMELPGTNSAKTLTPMPIQCRCRVMVNLWPLVNLRIIMLPGVSESFNGMELFGNNLAAT